MNLQQNSGLENLGMNLLNLGMNLEADNGMVVNKIS
jgi:hypothetical protein